MMASIAPPDRQHSLFEALPASEPRRRRARSRPAPPFEADAAAPAPVPSFAEPPSAPFPAPLPPLSPPLSPPLPLRIDAASLTRPDLCDLVRDLAEPSLGFLLVEAAREVKRRLAPDDPEDQETPPEPSPQLLRAIRSTVSELAEGE